jgi:hypothetical protein
LQSEGASGHSENRSNSRHHCCWLQLHGDAGVGPAAPNSRTASGVRSCTAALIAVQSYSPTGANSRPVKFKLLNCCGFRSSHMDADPASRHAVFSCALLSRVPSCPTLASCPHCKRYSRPCENHSSKLRPTRTGSRFTSSNGQERLIANEPSPKSRPCKASADPPMPPKPRRGMTRATSSSPASVIFEEEVEPATNRPSIDNAV